MMQFLIRLIARYLPFALLATALSLLVYIGGQQTYRQNLNDPQIQIAEGAAKQIEAGVSYESVIPAEKVEMSTSLHPWVAVYDASGTPLFSSGLLDGALPELPSGVFDTSTWLPHKTYLSEGGVETRFTWEHASPVRQAVVLVKFAGPNGTGYVASGRSMREIENRIANWGSTVFSAWIAIMGSLLILLFLLLLLKL